MSCNAKKTMCMVFNPKDRKKIITMSFPQFTLDNISLQYASEFKYLGHLISNNFTDDTDIQREVRNMFVRTNILIRRFSRCSTAVKVVLFKSFCLCLYDSALWKSYNATTLNKLMSCYHKCIKLFFGFKRRDSVTNILLQLSLPSFSTLLVNGCVVFTHCFTTCMNAVVRHLNTLGY